MRGPERPVPAATPKRVLAPASFADLAGWSSDRQDAALAAFVRGCAGIASAASGGSGGELGAALAADRQAVAALCAAARRIPADDPAAARTFFEREFTPWAASDRGRREGLLTGYYEPEIAARRRRQGSFVHPLYFPPADRVAVDLGEFKRDLAGRRIVGRIARGRFLPYFDRAAIEAGALSGRRLELAWVDDPVALFFLQIQGSGRLRLEDGSIVRVGYAGQNGHDYTAIGRVLAERGEIPLEEVSLQSIRAWLAAHPREAPAILDANRSYVFFRELAGGGPVGASGVELTPRRSLAVDPAFWPYGLPLWAAATLPEAPEIGRSASSLAALLVAQDTGGAIRGPIRGDLFWGPGSEAEAMAGRMKEPLRLWLLWPRALPPPEVAAPPVTEAAAPPLS